MAWQSPSGLVGNGAAAGGGGDGQSNGGQPHGTEYTLQGVMRFLHTEWHRHERDRNAWEIERAEMKARIAKLEGEHRTNKKLQESYSRQIQMLENVIKKERENFKAAVSGDSLASVPAKEPKGKEKEKEHPETKGLDVGGERPPAPKPHNSFLEVEDSPEGVPPFQGDVERHKSNGFLEKCIHEVTYLLTPPIHPAPQPLQHNPQDLGQGFPGVQQPSMEELYARRQQSQQQGIGLSQPSPSPNHQPPPVPGMNASFPQNQHHQSMRMQRSLAEQHPISQFPAASNFDRPQPQPGLMSAPEEPVEKVVHSFDSYGRQIPARTAEGNIPTHILAEEPPPDPDGWNFDDTSPVPIEPSEVAQSQRRDTDVSPSADQSSAKSPTRTSLSLHRRKSSNPRRRSDGAHELRDIAASQLKSDSTTFKVKFALRGHLDVVRSVIFTGGGSPSEPEICTTGDDGVIKRWIIPATYGSYGSHGAGMNNDLDIQSYFTHRGHQGVVTSLAACPAPQNFSSGGRAIGDGWIFSGGQDATVRVWERGRVDPKATLDGHTDAVWSVCVLPATSLSVFGADSNNYGGPDRILLASGSADGTVKIWAVSAPPQLSSPHSGSRRGVGGSRRHSVSSGSNFPSSPQPSTASATPFNYTLIHTISRPDISASPTCIAPLAMTGENFVVSYTDASVLIFDTRTGEEIVGMASLETSDSTPATAVNAVVATTVGLETSSSESGRSVSEDDPVVHGATGSRESGIEGVVISGHEDRYIRFFDANSGQCTYTMLAHPSSISSLSPSPDGRELVSAGHDASLRFWSLEKRSCTQEITSHRLMRGEGVCSVVWSQDGRWVVSGGGDGVVKVFARS